MTYSLRMHPLSAPTPEDITAARSAAGLSKTDAGALVHTNYRAWQRWETGERAMHPAFFELFLIKTGQAPVGVSE